MGQGAGGTGQAFLHGDRLVPKPEMSTSIHCLMALMVSLLLPLHSDEKLVWSERLVNRIVFQSQ